jgi:hypothetical protein
MLGGNGLAKKGGIRSGGGGGGQQQFDDLHISLNNKYINIEL